MLSHGNGHDAVRKLIQGIFPFFPPEFHGNGHTVVQEQKWELLQGIFTFYPTEIPWEWT